MIDIIKKRSEIVANKKVFSIEKLESPKIYVLYLLNGDDIVFINKIADYKKYIEEKKNHFIFTHYFIEELEIEDAANYVAELVLKLKPIYNNNVPLSSKYISYIQAKDKYGVYKNVFRKIWKEHGEQLMFEDRMYIETQIIQDITGQFKEYHKNLPKLGTGRIILKKNYIEIDIGGYQHAILFDEKGIKKNALVNSFPDWQEIYDSLIHNQKNHLTVISIIDTETFEVIGKDGKKYTLNAKDKDIVWRIDYEWTSMEHVIEMLEKSKKNGENQ